MLTAAVPRGWFSLELDGFAGGMTSSTSPQSSAAARTPCHMGRGDAATSFAEDEWNAHGETGGLGECLHVQVLTLLCTSDPVLGPWRSMRGRCPVCVGTSDRRVVVMTDATLSCHVLSCVCAADYLDKGGSAVRVGWRWWEGVCGGKGEGDGAGFAGFVTHGSVVHVCSLLFGHGSVVR